MKFQKFLFVLLILLLFPIVSILAEEEITEDIPIESIQEIQSEVVLEEAPLEETEEPAVDTPDQEEPPAEPESPRVGVDYMTHVQDLGWTDIVGDGTVSGTTGQGKKIEAIRISGVNLPNNSHLEYATHLSGIGWTNYTQDGLLSGTEGQNRAIEAIKIRLSGPAAYLYDIYYKTHVSDYGWLGWGSNDSVSGTTGYAKKVEAIQILLVPKTEGAPGPTGNAAMEKSKISGGDYGFTGPTGITYEAYVSNLGWLGQSVHGQTAGTTGRGLALEKLRAKLGNLSGTITYATFLSNKGWTAPKTQWEESGESDSGLHVEAVSFGLEGDIKRQFDLYYRVHVRNLGWLDWVKTGQTAGTCGANLPVEAFEIRLVPKPAPAPGSMLMGFIDYGVANKPKLPAIPGCPSITNLLATAIEPIGNTMYVLGGGWDLVSGAGPTARHIGLWPTWPAFYAQQNASYNYAAHNYEIYNGLDCSGYVGWVVYNVRNRTNNGPGEVYLADRQARMYAQKGYGNYCEYQSFNTFQAGDIVSLNYDAHVYIVIGQCPDGSVVLVHSSPPGVMITGTSVDGRETQATQLAHYYMKRYYPDFYRKYHNQINRKSNPYLSRCSKMWWNPGVVSDPENLRAMNAAQVLRVLLGD